MITFFVLSLLLLPSVAEADDLKSLLAGGPIKITASEMNEVLAGVEHDGFLIERQGFLDGAGIFVPGDQRLSDVQLSCVVSQLQALKKVDWKKYGKEKTKITLFTKKHMTGNSFKPTVEGAKPDSLQLSRLELLHIYHPEHEKCDYWDKTRIEARLDEYLKTQRIELAAEKARKEEADRLAEESNERKKRIIDLLQKSSLYGRSPAVLAMPGECSSGQTICAQDTAVKVEGSDSVGRQPAYLDMGSPAAKIAD